MDYIAEARKLRPIIETAVQHLTDKDASESVCLFPRLYGNGKLIDVGTLVRFNGTVYRAASALWDRPENWPDKAPALWGHLKYQDGIRIIPASISVSESFQQGEKGWWESTVWVSMVNDNTYTPEQAPEYWEKVN